MKSLVTGIALLAAIFVVGCQDINNNPVSSDGSKASPFALIKQTKGVIPHNILDVNGQLTIGTIENLDNTFDVSGNVQYSLDSTNTDSYAFTYTASVMFTSLVQNGGTGKIGLQSSDVVTIPGKDPVSVQEDFPIVGLGRDLHLQVMFSVTKDQVSISNMWLTDGAAQRKLAVLK